MHPHSELLDALAGLCAYPDADHAQRARAAGVLVASAAPAVAEAFDAYLAFVTATPPEELQERFTATFDCNQECALEVGWHVFGERYQRGEFLGRMRVALRELGIEETLELPDHLSHVLRVLARLDEERARKLVRRAVAHALRTIEVALERRQSPFRALLRTVGAAITAKVGAVEPEEVAHV